MKPKKIFRLLLRYVVSRLRGRPYVLHIEVTHRCNARCGHCVCWRIEPEKELPDYSGLVKQFSPTIVWITGGEPLLRKDITQVIRNIKEREQNLYLGMSTNGWLLTPSLGRELVEAGLDQVNVSLDFIGARHDEFRKIDGLFCHLESIIPDLQDIGLTVVLTCCILESNLDSLLPIAEQAKDWGVEVGYSCYSSLKTGDTSKAVSKEQYKKIQQIVDILCSWKKNEGTIKSSFSYLKKVPYFFMRGTVGTCSATKKWLYVSPDGHLKICPDGPVYAHYKDDPGPLTVECGDCWYTCRGEMETPFLERFRWELRNLRKTRTPDA